MPGYENLATGSAILGDSGMRGVRRGYVVGMTETPRESEIELSQKDVDRSAELDRADTDPQDEPNAPNREPETERVGPADSGPTDVPGPLEPGENDPDRRPGTESYERPGRDGNWDDSDLED